MQVIIFGKYAVKFYLLHSVNLPKYFLVCLLSVMAVGHRYSVPPNNSQSISKIYVNILRVAGFDINNLTRK